MPPIDPFWLGQLIYINEIFMPVIIGVLVFVPALVLVFLFGFWRRARLWKLGRKEDRSGHSLQRLLTTLGVVASARIIRKNELYPGIMHSLMFWGVALLLAGKIVRLFSFVSGVTVPPQNVYLYSSFVSEIGTALAIIGGLMAVLRRYILKPPRLDNQPEDSLVFIWVAVILLTGFMAKGYRIAVSEVIPSDWALWSPVSFPLSRLFPTFVLETKNEILVWHRTLIHTVPALVLLGYVWLNRSRLQHILLSPLNIYLRNLGAMAAPEPINIEAPEALGAGKPEEFTWKQLLDLDACTRCGRCQDACPAHFSGKALNPKKVINDLERHLYELYPVPLSTKAVEPHKDMVTDVVTEEVLWDCTTCGACQESCPVYIEHILKIVDMRRNLVLARNKMPETVQLMLRNMQSRGHPWAGVQSLRLRGDWTAGLDVKILPECGDVDILLFVGCTGALVERNVQATLALVKVLKAAGINFGVLGQTETCCGDPARRVGYEFQFQIMAEQNIAMFKEYNIKKIVTACPHCYNSFKNEYTRYGADFQAVHYTQLIAELIKGGRLKLNTKISSAFTYHDPCYLGRYNAGYSAPREIINVLSGATLREMERSRNRSFCCGGGGGHTWMEEQTGTRVNVNRLAQVLQTGADTVVTACPYCLQMMEEGIERKEVKERLKARDIAELVAEAMGQPAPTAKNT